MPFNSIFAWVMKKRIHQIELFKKYPNYVQEELLLKLINTAKNTEYGIEKDFATIHKYTDCAGERGLGRPQSNN